MRRQLLPHLVIDVLLAFGALGGPARALLAQAEPPLTPGAHVRATIPCALAEPEHQIEGSRARLRGTTVVIDTTSIATASPVFPGLDAGRARDIVPGKHGHTAEGVLLGALLGGIGGGLIAQVTYHPCDSCFFDWGSGPQVAGGAFLGILAGALIGGAIGSSIQTDVWAPVPTSDVRVAISSRGVGLAVGF